MFRTLPLWGALALGLAWQPARAAEDYDSCSGFIDSLPATIAKQGTWCLRKDLATAISQGAAITIATSNVTIDCNDFKIGGLGAGVQTFAIGIAADGRQNATVRNCNLRGFYLGLQLKGSGHLVEDNRVEGSTYQGIFLEGDGSTARRNLVIDTGGTPSSNSAYAINSRSGSVEILDNVIDGVSPASTFSNGSATGILVMRGDGSVIAGNRVRNLVAVGEDYSTAIQAYRNPAVSYFVSPALTWHEARDYCQANHSTLAVIDSEAEATTYGNYARSMGSYLWIGGSDAAQEGQWTWTDGRPLDFTRWAPGEPNNIDGMEHYLAIDPDGTWIDADAPKPYGYICEYADKTPIIVRGNVLRGNSGAYSYGIRGQCLAADNIVGAEVAITCFDAGGNQVSP